jgi:hypothetical protein
MRGGEPKERKIKAKNPGPQRASAGGGETAALKGGRHENAEQTPMGENIPCV